MKPFIFVGALLISAVAWAAQPTTLPTTKAQAKHISITAANGTLATPGAAVANRKIPDDAAAAYQLYKNAAAKAANGAYNVDAEHLSLLALGPQLNSGDQANCQTIRWDKDKGRIEIAMAYTSGDVRGVQYRRNVPWAPLIIVPLPEVPKDGPWPYTVEVTWTCSDKPAAGIKAPAPIVVSAEFQVSEQKGN